MGFFFGVVKAHFMRFVLWQHFGTVLYQYNAGLLLSSMYGLGLNSPSAYLIFVLADSLFSPWHDVCVLCS